MIVVGCRSFPTKNILFYSILFYSILFYSILFYSILTKQIKKTPSNPRDSHLSVVTVPLCTSCLKSAIAELDLRVFSGHCTNLTSSHWFSSGWMFCWPLNLLHAREIFTTASPSLGSSNKTSLPGSSLPKKSSPLNKQIVIVISTALQAHLKWEKNFRTY